MRSGGSKAKGSAWEREVGRRLSLWLTDGVQDDLFSRTVLSGGQFTRSGKGISGDLMANGHPLAFRFLEKFSIECKHWASAGLEEFILKASEKCPISKAIEQATAGSPNKEFMLIIKENRKPAFVIMGLPQKWLSAAPHHSIFGIFTLVVFQHMLEIPANCIFTEKETTKIPVKTNRVKL
jgi:hypothetical protein